MAFKNLRLGSDTSRLILLFVAILPATESKDWLLYGFCLNHWAVYNACDLCYTIVQKGKVFLVYNGQSAE